MVGATSVLIAAKGGLSNHLMLMSLAWAPVSREGEVQSAGPPPFQATFHDSFRTLSSPATACPLPKKQKKPRGPVKMRD